MAKLFFCIFLDDLTVLMVTLDGVVVKYKDAVGEVKVSSVSDWRLVSNVFF